MPNAVRKMWLMETTMTSPAAPFSPDWASPPGETIRDLARERGWTEVELAARLGYTSAGVSRLLSGNAAVTAEVAARLESVLAGPAHFWLNREGLYRAQRARVTDGPTGGVPPIDSHPAD